MRFGSVLVAVLAAAVAVFALQNTDQTAVRFMIWRLDGVPVAGLVLASLAAGLLLAGVPLWIRLRIWRNRARMLEAQVRLPATGIGERGPGPAGPPAQH